MKYKLLIYTGLIMCVFLSCKKNCPETIDIISNRPDFSWRTFHYNNQRTAYLPISMNVAGNIKWQLNFDAANTVMNLLVDGTTIYATTITGKLYAIDKITKQTKWVYSAGGAIYGSPTMDEKNIYFGSGDKKVYALDKVTGNLKWSFTANDEINSGIIIDGDYIYFGSNLKRAYAVNKVTGTLKWSTPTVDFLNSAPTIDGNLVYFNGYVNGEVFAFDKNTGQLIWKYETNSMIDWNSAPVTSETLLYVTTYDGDIYALNKATGQLVWSYATGGKLYSTPVVDENTVYFSGLDVNNNNITLVYALDKITGDFKWDFEAPGDVYSGVFADMNKLYIGCTNKLCILNKLTGAKEKEMNTPGYFVNGLVTDKKTLYYGATQGMNSVIYAIE